MSDITPNSESFDQILNAGRQRRRRPWVLAVVICLGIAALAFSNPRGNQGPTFETVDLEQRDLIATVSATGRLEPVLKVDVGSEISGTMAEVLVDSNDPVRAGQVLARIDTTKLEQQTERSRATLLSAQALLANSLQIILPEADVVFLPYAGEQNPHGYALFPMSFGNGGRCLAYPPYEDADGVWTIQDLANNEAFTLPRAGQVIWLPS